MRSDRERKTPPEAERPCQIADPDLAWSPAAVEPDLPRDHHRWAFPVEVVPVFVFTVPGPSALVAAEIAARNKPPRPRIRRNAATFPVRRSSPRPCRTRVARGAHGKGSPSLMSPSLGSKE